jgi:hypothetical protein
MSDRSPWHIRTRVQHGAERAGRYGVNYAKRHSSLLKKHPVGMGGVQSDAASGYGPPPKKRPSTHDVQAYLRKLGYNIAVDGDMGPITRSAMAAHAHKIGAHAWNMRNAHIDDANQHNTPVNKNNQRDVATRPNRHMDRQPNVRPVNVRSGKTGHTVMKGGAGKSEGMSATRYVDAMMDAQYGPILAELQRQETSQTNIGNNKMAEERDMYNNWSTDLAARAATGATDRAKNIQAIEAPNFAVGMDPAVAAELAARSDISADTARTLSAGDAAFDQRMIEAAKAGGVFAASQANQDMQSKVKDIQAQRTDVLGQRGAARNVALQDKMQSDREYGLKLQEMIAGMQGMGLDTAKAELQLEAMRSGLVNDVLGRQKAMADIKYRNKQTRLLGTNKGKGTQAFPRKFDKLRPDDRQKLSDIVLGHLNGVPNANTQTIVRIINNSLRSYGYKPRGNRTVGEFAASLYGAYTGRNPNRKWWGLG